MESAQIKAEPKKVPTETPVTGKTGAAPVNLASIIRQDVENLMWVEFQYGIFFQLKYLNRQTLQKLSKQATIMKYDSSVKARVPQLDADAVTEGFFKIAVKGWRGVTPRSLSKIVPIALESLTDAQKDEEIPFSQQSLLAITKEAYELDQFLQNAATDISTFDPDKEPSEKNSEASPLGN